MRRSASGGMVRHSFSSRVWLETSNCSVHWPGNWPGIITSSAINCAARTIASPCAGECWQTDQSVMAHRLHLVERLDLGPRLSRVSAPAVVLAGDRDLLVSPHSLQQLSSGLPNSRGEILSGCGHLAFVTHPQLV